MDYATYLPPFTGTRRPTIDFIGGEKIPLWLDPWSPLQGIPFVSFFSDGRRRRFAPWFSSSGMMEKNHEANRVGDGSPSFQVPDSSFIDKLHPLRNRSLTAKGSEHFSGKPKRKGSSSNRWCNLLARFIGPLSP